MTWSSFEVRSTNNDNNNFFKDDDYPRDDLRPLDPVLFNFIFNYMLCLDL
jgi:hypothetical protein